MMFRIEAGDSANRSHLKSVREETGRPVSTWTRMISFKMARLRTSSPDISSLSLGVLMIAEPRLRMRSAAD